MGSSDSRAITEAEQELGIGMTLYFRQMKFFAIVFLILTVLSVPSLIFYHGTGGPTSNLFFTTSIGNLGQSDIACSSTEFSQNKTNSMTLQCESGTMSKIVDFGLESSTTKCPSKIQATDKILALADIQE